MSTPDCKNRTKDPLNVSLLDENWQHLQQLGKMRSLSFIEAIASFSN
jgi:hypothetical protein